MAADGWSVIALLAFLSWIVCTLRFIFTAFPGLGLFHVRPALIWGPASFVAACVWIIALRNA